ncbi:MAG TPA: histidine phosphatase family protein [Tepidisphaeraceae bacterium]|nr:histidine phosphatase family protein [Tepidisphaeraceae bacterium]
MRLYIIRHADPDYERDNLTPAGHLEARALSERMERIAPTHIYSSPMGRAKATMQYSAERLGMQGIVEDWMAELSDCRLTLEPWGRLVMWDIPGEIIRAKAPYATQENWHELSCLSVPNFRERFEKLKGNSDEFISRHGYGREGGLYRPVRPNRDRIAVFCHGGFGLCWLAHLLEIPLPLMFAGFFLHPSSVTTILFDERSKEWAVPKCIGMGDISHLYANELPPQPSGIKANYE